MRANWIKGYAAAMDMLPQPIWCDLYTEYLSDFFHKWTQKNSQVMTGKRTTHWQFPTKPEGALLVALFIMENYAYAGHGESDSFDHMADWPTLQAALDQRKDEILKHIRTVYTLEKLCDYPFDSGRHAHNGRSRLLQELLIPTLITAVGPLILATVEPMLTPEQTAALNRIRVQDIALQQKTHLLNLHQSGQQDEAFRAIAAVTNPNPLQKTTAPELPAAMMEDVSDDEENRTHVCKGPPQQVVHPPPTEEQMQEKPLRKVNTEDELQAAQVLDDNFAVLKATLQD